MKVESSVSRMETIVVGISLNEEKSAELVSWAISVAATPGDTVLVVHVAVKEERKLGDFVQSFKAKIERANAFTIHLLGSFIDLCQAKQVKTEAKVLVDSSVEKGLIDEVNALGASFLILGDSVYNPKRPNTSITKYCLQQAPVGCSVVILKGGRLPHLPEAFPKIVDNLEFTDEGIHRLSLKWSGKDVAKTFTFLQKRFCSKISSGYGDLMVKVNNKSNGTRTHKEKPSSVSRVLEDYDSESSPSTSKSGPSGNKLFYEEEDSGYNQQNCLNILKNINVAIPPLFSSSFGRRSVHETPTEYEISDKSETIGNVSPRVKPTWRCFTYEEIIKATDNFHPDNVVGRGGYAEVYKGVLEDGQIVAVKRLANENRDEQKEKDFLTELGVIGHVYHPNTASLLGCCIENGLHLLFHFSANGSLASVLHGTNAQLLTWPVRYKIAVGTARGLHYLHKCCQRRIIHRDIKASNVLLGPDFEPQISDFGLAKWLPTQWSHHSISPVEGTFGYLAPEYFLHGIVDEKTDVYAFGVLLLEIISGRKPSDISEQNIMLWAKPLLESGNIVELVDPRLDGQYDLHQMQRMVLTSSLCVRQSAIWRPSMSEALQLLTDNTSLEIIESWRMPEFQKDEVDDYIDWDDNEYSQRFKCISPSP